MILRVEQLEDRSLLSTDSAGHLGINALAATLPSGGALTGNGITIGMVEPERPGSTNAAPPGPGLPAGDSVGNRHSHVNPSAVFLQTTTPAPADTGIDPHALNVAGVMVANGPVPTDRGVAREAMLFASADNVLAGKPTVNVALSMQAVATHNNRAAVAINFSAGHPMQFGDKLDGRSLLTQFVDWSAHFHDTLYVIAGNQDKANNVLPTDEFNGITVASSMQNTPGGKWDQIDTRNSTLFPPLHNRRPIELLAPGRDVWTTVLNPAGGPSGLYQKGQGTSIAAPHVTAAAALLQQFAKDRLTAGAANWDNSIHRHGTFDTIRHEIIKAVLLNSAVKLDGAQPGMDRDILDTNGSVRWTRSLAEDRKSNPVGEKLPLDFLMGAGHLNVDRAVTQLSPGRRPPPADGSNVPLIGWDYNSLNNPGFHRRYPLGTLAGSSYVSITLAWDRVLTLTDNPGGTENVYNAGESWAASPLADLDLYLMPAGETDPSKRIYGSISTVDNVEHLFFKLPAKDDQYEFWVHQHGATSSSYAVAWRAVGGVPPPALPGYIADRVWIEQNANGILDAGEGGAAYVGVDLYDATNNWIDTTTTDANGYYEFTSVTPGSYSVQFTTPVGYDFTVQNAGEDDALDSDADSSGRTSLFEVVSSSITTIDAGLVIVPPGSISGRVWQDSDDDGLQDELGAGTEGATVYLLDAAGSAVDVAITDEEGVYEFASVRPGDYRLQFEPPYQHDFTLADQGDDTLDSDVDGDGLTGVFTVGSGQSVTTFDAGLRRTYFLTGGAWADENGDGVQDGDEDSLSEVLVRLLASNGTELDSTVTDEYGEYGFADLAPGDYSVEFAAPTGYRFSPRGQGADNTIDSDVYRATGRTGTVTLTAGEDAFFIDAGLVENTAPVAVPDGVYEIHQGQMLNVPGAGVMANDSDPEEDPLTAELVSDVSHGYLTFNHRYENGSAVYYPGAFYYTAHAGYTGEDSFTYRLHDGALYSNTVTGTINVTDEAPVAIADGLYEVHQGQMLNVPGEGVLANDSDTDDDPLTAELESDVGHGYLTFNHRYENGSAIYDPGAFYYTAYAGYTGEDSFTYRVYDGALYSPTVTVTIDVTDEAPVAQDDGVHQVHQGQLLNVPGEEGVLLNDSDPDQDPLIAELVSDVSHGYLTFNHRFEYGSAIYDPGAFYYTAYAGYTGANSFTYRVSDGALWSNTVTVTIDVTDTAPVAQNDGVYEVHQGQLLNVPGEGVLVNDSDPDEDALTAELVSDVGHGYLTFNHRYENGSAIYDPGAFYYTSHAGYSGSDSFTYRVFDGALYSEIVTVTLNVLPLATITGRAWGDADTDGVRDETELGWAGIVVRLLDGEGVEVATTTTDSEGNYTFGDVLLGSYRVQFVPPAGFSFTLQNLGDEAFDSDVDATGVSELFWLVSGQLYDHLDAGIVA